MTIDRDLRVGRDEAVVENRSGIFNPDVIPEAVERVVSDTFKRRGKRGVFERRLREGSFLNRSETLSELNRFQLLAVEEGVMTDRSDRVGNLDACESARFERSRPDRQKRVRQDDMVSLAPLESRATDRLRSVVTVPVIPDGQKRSVSPSAV